MATVAWRCGIDNFYQLSKVSKVMVAGQKSLYISKSSLNIFMPTTLAFNGQLNFCTVEILKLGSMWHQISFMQILHHIAWKHCYENDLCLQCMKYLTIIARMFFSQKKYIAVQENGAVFRRKTNQSWMCMLDCEV